MNNTAFYSFSGVVQAGKGFGRSMGFPTANIPLNSFPLAFGVYLCRVEVEDASAPEYGIVNIGVDPTFGKDNALGAEVYLFDFTGDLYGKKLQIHLMDFLRAEQAFSTVSVLKEQIKRDVKRAQDRLNAGDLRIVAHLYNDFPTKFGLPRQSGMLKGALSRVVFEEEFCVPEAIREIGQYSHLWLLWQFSGFRDAGWSPTVRPPRLGGNKRIGVFASRAPHRPNPIGLSSVRLRGVEQTPKEGTVLIVEGADIMSGTPIYDIKPYLAFTDAHPDAIGGYPDDESARLKVFFSDKARQTLPPEALRILRDALAQDPRPAYQNEPERVYLMLYGDYTISFTCEGKAIEVRDVQRTVTE